MVTRVPATPVTVSESLASSLQTNASDMQAPPMSAELLSIFICLGVLALLIVLANSLVFFLVVDQPTLRSKTNYFLISLAASDLSSGLVAVPLLISCNVIQGNYRLLQAMDICQRFLAISSILHLSGAVTERYIKMSEPFKHHDIVTRRRLIAAIVCIWVSALTAALVQVAWDDAVHQQTMNLVYSAVVLFVFVLVPYLLSLTAFVLMYVIIRRGLASRRRMTHHYSDSKRLAKSKGRFLREKRVVAIYFAMVTCFTVGWFPYFLFALFDDLGHEFHLQLPFWLSVTLLFLKYGTSLINPLLFTFLKADFQAAMRATAMRGPWRLISRESGSSSNSSADATRYRAATRRLRRTEQNETKIWTPSWSMRTRPQTPCMWLLECTCALGRGDRSDSEKKTPHTQLTKHRKLVCGKNVQKTPGKPGLSPLLSVHPMLPERTCDARPANTTLSLLHNFNTRLNESSIWKGMATIRL